MGLLASLLGGCAADPPAGLGVHAGQFKACPSAPHCVSSQASAREHRVAPIDYTGSRSAARDTLLATIRALSRTNILHADDDYIHAIQRSRWLGFVDDLECYLPVDQSIIEVRSASRIGYYDFGVNRARIERLRRDMHDRLGDSG